MRAAAAARRASSSRIRASHFLAFSLSLAFAASDRPCLTFGFLFLSLAYRRFAKFNLSSSEADSQSSTKILA